MSKRLGQHFLQNRAAIRAIVRAVDPRRDETVVEIGPGHGELTLPMLKRCREVNARLVAIERDAHLVDELREAAVTPRTGGATVDEFKIIEGDALALLPPAHSLWKLVGNIPYYLTGRLFRIIGELPRKPSRIVFTLQREVAERLCAKPPAMNLLAASVQIWAKPKIIRRLAPADFRPQPKVESAVVKLETRNVSPFGRSPEGRKRETRELQNYYRLIKILFKQPRQTIANNLARGLALPKEEIRKKLSPLGLTGDERPQELSIKTLERLSATFPQSS